MAVKFWGHYSTTQIREKSKKCDCILFPLIFLQRYNKYGIILPATICRARIRPRLTEVIILWLLTIFSWLVVSPPLV